MKVTQQKSATWEFRNIDMSRETSRESARELLTSVAETDNWELDQLRIFPDGRRRARLRRRVIRVARTA
ncbi:MAG: hypothetical protein EXQ60_01820 [Candidatus Nanopelagicales bacterium]|nr:hypothetical protein [Candidatus Nanopelagicales bacterium]